MLINCGVVALLPAKRLSIHGYYVGTAEECYDTVQFSQKHGIKALVERFPLAKSEDAFQHRAKALFRAVILPWA
jgi:D-arabinose 1-dehydrogenase-like Zn-dependent alcohol dehydrogenase